MKTQGAAEPKEKAGDPAVPAAQLDPSFRARANAFAVAAGCVVFILAILVGAASGSDPKALGNAIVLAIICSVTSWAATMRIVAETAGAIDRLIVRVRAAAQGELDISLDKQAREELPELVESIDRLLDRVRTSLNSFHDLAMHDSVTGLPNRLHLRREAERLLYSLNEDQAALMFIDLDRFKTVNDTLGHHIGDQLLGMVAARLNIVVDADHEENERQLTRPLVARLGGDEFTILMPGITDEAMAHRLGRRVLRALTEPFEIAGHSIEVGASIGIALHNERNRGLMALMRNADLAMYHAKALGRGQVQLYSPALSAHLDERRALENQLRRALEFNQFEIFLQPQIRAADQQVMIAEALLRWRHPDGLRLPGSFIDIAEESGLIVDIGEWVLYAVAQRLAAWHRLGLNIRIAVNISPRQLERADFFCVLQDAMEKARAPWDLLELEITESCLMNYDPQVTEQFARLRGRGVTIAVDDFGTGYSNLARLRSLPIDRLKIDRSLIADITRSGEAATISHAIVALAHGLGYTVVAEGVENQMQVEMLRLMGVDVLQGYLFAKPMPEKDFLPWVRQFSSENVRSIIRI